MQGRRNRLAWGLQCVLQGCVNMEPGAPYGVVGADMGSSGSS